MRRNIIMLVFCILMGMLGSGCVSGRTPVVIKDSNSWTPERAFSVINKANEPKLSEIRRLSESSNIPAARTKMSAATNKKELQDQIDHVVCENGLTFINLKTRTDRAVTGEVKHIPFSDISSVSLKRTMFPVVMSLFTLGVAPPLVETYDTEVVLKSGTMDYSAYVKPGSDRTLWLFFPFWVVRPLYYVNNTNTIAYAKNYELAQAFEYLRQNPSLSINEPHGDKRLQEIKSIAKEATTRAASGSGLVGGTMTLEFDATDKNGRKTKVELHVEPSSQGNSITAALPVLMALNNSPAKLNLLNSLNNSDFTNETETSTAFDAFGKSVAEVIRTNQKVIKSGSIKIILYRTTGLEAGIIDIVLDAKNTDFQYYVRPGYNSSQPKLKADDAKDAFSKLLWRSK